jgi:hypothetical protein
MVHAPQGSVELHRNRHKVLAKSFYRTLRAEGLSHEEVIEVSTALLDLVTTEIRETPAPVDRRR